jgi:hypothetical protein
MAGAKAGVDRLRAAQPHPHDFLTRAALPGPTP